MAVAVLAVAALAAAFVLGRVTAPATGTTAEAPATSAGVPAASDGSAGLSAPTLVSPPTDSDFDYYPRDMTLRWQAVPGAASYVLEVQALNIAGDSEWFDLDGGRIGGITSTSSAYSFVGAQPGRWRITAVDASGRAGTPSEWWTFTFAQ